MCPKPCPKTKPTVTITLEGAPSTSSKPWLPEQSRASPSTKPIPESPPSQPRIKQLEEKITKPKNCRETIISIYRSQLNFLFDRFRALNSEGTDTILWKLTSLKLVFDSAKSSTRLDDAAKDPSTRYINPLFRTHPYGYNFFFQFYPFGLTLPREPTPQLYSFYSTAITMVY